MTKSAALAFHEGLAAELRNDKFGFAAPEIKLTCVHPTWAETAMTEPFRQKLEAAGMKFIEPQTVADAVVNQVLSGRSKQIVLGGGIGWIAGIRAWPSWLSGGLAAIEGTRTDSHMLDLLFGFVGSVSLTSCTGMMAR